MLHLIRDGQGVMSEGEIVPGDVLHPNRQPAAIPACNIDCLRESTYLDTLATCDENKNSESPAIVLLFFFAIFFNRLCHR